METYQKINGLFKRYPDGPNKGRFIMGEYATPEIEYLAGNQWEFTEKVDGTNIRVGVYLGTIIFGGRSDNAVIPNSLLEYLKETFTWQSFREAFSEVDLSDVTLYGEGYGPKIQGGGKYRDDVSFVLFDVKIGPWWLSRDDVDDVARKLGIESVPVIGRGTLYDAINLVQSGTRLLKITDDYVIPQNLGDGLISAWGDFEAEGIVARPVVPMFNRKGERVITKIKAVDFR